MHCKKQLQSSFFSNAFSELPWLTNRLHQKRSTRNSYKDSTSSNMVPHLDQEIAYSMNGIRGGLQHHQCAS